MTWQTTTTLYNHQQRGVDKLAPARVGALFMEMGTGKTRTAIQLAYLRQQRIDRVVWYCPVSAKQTIRHEILKHTTTPETAVYCFDENTSIRSLPDAFWYVVGTESMSSSDRVTLAVNHLITENTMVVMDESDMIKGHNSTRTRRITAIGEKAKYRLILTGTPLSQGVVDLYAQMRFLSPKILGYNSFYSFAANHLEYSDKYPGLIVRAHNVGYLTAKIQPYVYQVTKAECFDLPKKLYEKRYHDLSNEQWRAYQQAKDEILLSVEEEEITSYTIFRLFSALQQIVGGFWNRDGQLLEFDHNRLDVLLGAVDCVPAECKVIIWCKYRYSVRAIAEALTAEFGADAGCLFYGDVPERQREANLTRFRGDGRFLVATAECGGRSLTINEAHYSIFYENEFKYMNRLQAEDRNHRDGQEFPVTYIDVVSNANIDQRIMRSHAKKGDVVDDFKQQVARVKDDKSLLRKLIEEL